MFVSSTTILAQTNEKSHFVVQSRWILELVLGRKTRKKHRERLSHTWKKAGRPIRDAHRRRTQESRINRQHVRGNHSHFQLLVPRPSIQWTTIVNLKSVEN